MVGFQREIAAPASQSLNGTTYQFVGWSDNGAATHNIATPQAATTYTATYAASDRQRLPEPGLRAELAFGYPGPWRTSVTSPGKATLVRDTADFATGTASARMDISSASRDWHVQLLQPNVPLTAGKLPTLTF